jgi:acyl dehydratase
MGIAAQKPRGPDVTWPTACRLPVRSVGVASVAITTIDGLDQLRSMDGQELGVSDWHDVTQERVDAFAEATNDFQWIHVDPERAKETAFGGTIAHGLYTLSLGPQFCDAMWKIEGISFGLNYGYDKVRFPAPLPVGSRIRMRATLTSVADVKGGLQFTVSQTFEREGGDRPVCVAEAVGRVYS